MANLPQDQKRNWEAKAIYVSRRELEERHEQLKLAHSGLRTDNARLQGEVEALRGQVEEGRAALGDEKKSKWGAGLLGTAGGLAIGAIAGMIIGGDSKSDPTGPKGTEPA